MKKFYKALIIILALCLPWHGAITVFLPDFARYWKEIILALFFAGFLIPPLVGEVWWGIKDFSKKLENITTPFEFPLLGGKYTEFLFAVLFLIYGLILILFSADKIIALMAFRYLGLGFIVFLLFSLIWRNFAGFQRFFQKTFSKYFIFSAILSILFGTWIKFGNGAEITRNFYSQTISSWVPGQTIPLWHEAGDFVRMQGASSGPIEFSHLLLVVLFLTLISKYKNIYKILFSAIFLFGIWQSASRAAVLGAVIILIYHFIYPLKNKISEIIKKNKKQVLITVLILLFAGFWGIKNTNILERAGTSDHFTRPVAAVKFGLENIFSNNLGKLGPAARSKNLRENNNDTAMIAENIFVDVFAQMGIIGFIFYVLFFFFLFWQTKSKFRGFLLASFLVMNLATIFDMTPISIAIFSMFFIGIKEK